MRSLARRDTWAVRTRAAACGALAAALVLLPTGAASLPAPAGYAVHEPVPGLRVVLDDVDPTVPRAGEPLVLRGRVINGAAARQRITSVSVEAAWTPLTGRAAVADWVTGDDARRTDWILGTDTVGPVVAAGSEVPFTVTLPAETLAGLPADQTVLAVEVHAHDGAQDPASGLIETAPATLRTVLAVSGAPEVAEPLQVSWLVPLTLPPDPRLTDADDEDWGAAWSAATGPGSVVRTWLDEFRVDGVTWVVDPALLLPVRPLPLVGEEPLPPDEELVPTDDGRPGTDEDAATAEPAAPADDPAVTEEPDATDDSAATGPPPPRDEDAPTGPDPAGPSKADGSASTTGDPAEATEAPAEPPEDPPTATESVQADLAELRARLAAVDGRRLWWLPADDPDLTAVLGSDGGEPVLADLLRRRADAPDEVPELLDRGRTDVAWPLLEGPATAADLDRLRSVWPATGRDGTGALAAVVLPREAVLGSATAPVSRGAVPLTEPAGLTVLASDSRASGLLAAAGDAAEERGAGAAAQRILADTLAGWRQDPLVERSLLVAPPRRTALSSAVLAELSDGLMSAPWLEPVPAAALLTAARTAAPVTPAGAQTDTGQIGEVAAYLQPGGSPLDPAGVRRLVALRRHLQGLQEVLEDTSAPDSWEAVLAAAWSTRWRGEPEDWTRSWRGIAGATRDARQALHVNPSTINFLSDQGLLSVTIVNTLPVAIEDVHVELVPGSSILQVIDQPEPISVGADSRATVTFSARAVTRGETTVTARLTTPNGTALGDDAAVAVRVQPTGVWIYWVLGGIAGVVLALGLVRALRSSPRAVVTASRRARTPRAYPAAPSSERS